MKKIRDAKEQLQEDILTILEGFRVDEALDGEDYNQMVTELCRAAIRNLNSLTPPNPAQ